MLISSFLVINSMTERVNSVDDPGIITTKDGHTYLCRLVYIAEFEKRTMGRCVTFSEEEHDKLLSDALKNLQRSSISPDFYYEKWPVNESNCYGTEWTLPSSIHLRIEFYQKISPIEST